MEALGQLLVLFTFLILLVLAAVMMALRKLYLKLARDAKSPEEAKLQKELARLATTFGITCAVAAVLLLLAKSFNLF